MRVSLEELVVAARGRKPDPEFASVPDVVLVEGFSRLASSIAAARCRWLLMLAEIIRRGLWVEDGVTSPAAWLSYRLGEAAPTAREHIRVALALADWPLVTAEFAAGRMSYSKVRAIVSTHRPELDELLVRYAEAATGQQLQRICASFVTTDTEAVVDTWAARNLRMRELRGGMSEIRVVVPTEDALASFDRLDRRAQELWKEQHAARRAARETAVSDAAASRGADIPSDAAASLPPTDPIGALRADAFLEAVDALDAGVEPGATGRDRHLVVLHTTASAVEEPPAGQDRLVTVADDKGRTPTLSARVLRRLSCTGARHVAHDADGGVCSVRDERRDATSKQRRLLWLRDRGCRFPSCDRTRGLHAHHIVHWEDGGPTELFNLVLLCGTHHRFVHDRGWTIATDGLGRFSFSPPDAEPMPATQPLPGIVCPEAVFPEWPDEIPDDVDPWEVWPRSPLTPTAATARPDYDACVEVLHWELQRLRQPSPDDVVIAA